MHICEFGTLVETNRLKGKKQEVRPAQFYAKYLEREPPSNTFRVHSIISTLIEGP